MISDPDWPAPTMSTAPSGELLSVAVLQGVQRRHRVQRSPSPAVTGAALLVSAAAVGTGGSPSSSTGRCRPCGAGSARSAIPGMSSGCARRASAGWPSSTVTVLGDVLARSRPSAGPLDEALTTLAAAALALREQIAPRIAALSVDRPDHPRPAPGPAGAGRAPTEITHLAGYPRARVLAPPCYDGSRTGRSAHGAVTTTAATVTITAVRVVRFSSAS